MCLAVLQGNQDVFSYQQVLTTYLFAFVNGVHDDNYVFQHDNAITMSAHVAKDFPTDLTTTTMDWPAFPPNLNLVDSVWGLMERKNGRQYSTISELKDAVLAAWDEIMTDLLIKLSKSITDRCIAVVRTKDKKIAC